MRPLRILVIRAELGVVIEMPSRELTRGDPAWNRVKEAEEPLRRRMTPDKDRVVHDLVQQHREIEDRKTLNEGEGNPDERMLVPDQPPGGERQNRELAESDGAVPRWLLSVQIAHLIARNRRAELRPQPNRMLRVMVRFHGGSIVTAGSRRKR